MIPVGCLSFATYSIYSNLGHDAKLYPSDRHHFLRGLDTNELNEAEDPLFDYEEFMDDSQA